MAQVNREQWLMEAVKHIAPIFEMRGHSIPPVKVSVGFPSTGGKGRHLGQCWSSKAAVDNCESGHGEGFKKIALDVGRKGPMRSAGAGDHLKQDLIRITEKLGAFPHGRLSLPIPTAQKAPKRPGAKCAKCGYEVVMLKKYLHLGPPICPKDMEGMEEVGEWEDI
jgi:hypothetical protein